MSGFHRIFNLLRSSQRKSDGAIVSSDDRIVDISNGKETLEVVNHVTTEPDADHLVAPGHLSFEEDTVGGLGRHLGLFSTTFLMFVDILSFRFNIS